MEIHSLVWNRSNIEHIAIHHVIPEEVENICRRRPFIYNAPSKSQNPAYYVLGQTEVGRYLFAVIIYFGKGKGYVVTARDMTLQERRRFLQWKSK